MKRFFCKECNRIKWARRWPSDTVNKNSQNVMERVGTCKFHRQSPLRFTYRNAASK